MAGDRPASGAGPQAQEGQMTTTAPEIGRQVALDRIRVPDNVRTLDDAHVQALAGASTVTIEHALAWATPARRRAPELLE
jgi:hypothetical protein